jgi:hypothetical protein
VSGIRPAIHARFYVDPGARGMGETGTVKTDGRPVGAVDAGAGRH